MNFNKKLRKQFTRRARQGRQVGVIVFGHGLNKDLAIREAHAKGYKVNRRPGYAELWLP